MNGIITRRKEHRPAAIVNLPVCDGQGNNRPFNGKMKTKPQVYQGYNEDFVIEGG